MLRTFSALLCILSAMTFAPSSSYAKRCAATEKAWTQVADDMAVMVRDAHRARMRCAMRGPSESVARQLGKRLTTLMEGLGKRKHLETPGCMKPYVSLQVLVNSLARSTGEAVGAAVGMCSPRMVEISMSGKPQAEIDEAVQKLLGEYVKIP